MGKAGAVAAILALILGALVPPGRAQDVRCPHRSNDACDQWAFEQADKELVLLIARKLADLERRSSLPERNEEAKSSILEAQREWTRFRDAECKARATADMISARTREGLISQCLFSVTRQRIEEIKKY